MSKVSHQFHSSVIDDSLAVTRCSVLLPGISCLLQFFGTHHYVGYAYRCCYHNYRSDCGYDNDRTAARVATF